MLSRKNSRLLFICICVMLLTSCGNLKVICIDVDDLSQRTVTLRHPKDDSAASDTDWRNQRLINVDEKSGEFFTITNDKNHKKCYVNIYSSKGVFKKQFNCPYFQSWEFDAKMFGDEILVNNFMGGTIGFLVAAMVAPQLIREQLVSYNIKTGEKHSVFPNTSKLIEHYEVQKYDSETAIISISRHHMDYAENKNGKEIHDKGSLVIYNPSTKQMLPIQFPENMDPCMFEGIYPKGKVFWLSVNEEAPNGRFIAQHLFEISLDGSIMDISHLRKNENALKHKHIVSIIAKEDSQGEYVYLLIDERDATEHLDRDKAYLCRYRPDSGVKETMLKLGRKSMGISAHVEYASKERIGLTLSPTLLAAHYWEYFFFPPKNQYQIYDKDFKLLKTFPLPRLIAASMQIGHIFYQSY